MKPLIAHRFMLQIDRTGRLFRRCVHGPICGVRGCRQLANTCYLPDGEEEFYCYDHMRDQGYCPGCHQFWAGIESFDFSRSGYCENCASQGDYDDEDDWDEDLYEWDDLPRSDPWEAALANCSSMDWGQTCGGAGSEDCEFHCPIRQDYYRSLLKA